MTVQTWLDQNAKRLSIAGIGTARLDCLVLLEDCLNKDRTHILAHSDLLISSERLKWLDERIARRTAHEPLAYIRGKTEFYGRDFFVDKRVLEPRPESETLITLLKNLSNHKTSISRTRSWKVVDVGTGSGALAVTAKHEVPHAEVEAIDIDQGCLDVAKQNATIHNVNVTFNQGDLLEPVAKNYSLKPMNSYLILLCNLPYVPDDFHINTAAEAEPRIAIFGGEDGLDLYRRLFIQITRASWRPHIIFTESLPPQHEKLAEIAATHGFALTKTEDFIQQFEGG